MSPACVVCPAGIARRARHQGPAVLRHPDKSHIVFRHGQFFPMFPSIPGAQQTVLGTGKIQRVAVLRVHHQSLARAPAAEIAMHHGGNLFIAESLSVILRNGQLTRAFCRHTAGNVQPLRVTLVQSDGRRITLVQILHGHMVDQTLPSLLLRNKTVNAPDIRSGVQYARRLLMIQKTRHIAAARYGSVAICIGQLFCYLHPKSSLSAHPLRRGPP